MSPATATSRPFRSPVISKARVRACAPRRRPAIAGYHWPGNGGRSAHTMTTARLPKLPLDEAQAAADEAAVPNYMAELSIFQVLLNHPTLARGINDLLATMLWHGALDSRLRELVIMRIGWLTACDYEWTQHWRVACRLGVPAEDLLGVRAWQSHDEF